MLKLSTIEKRASRSDAYAAMLPSEAAFVRERVRKAIERELLGSASVMPAIPNLVPVAIRAERRAMADVLRRRLAKLGTLAHG